MSRTTRRKNPRLGEFDTTRDKKKRHKPTSARKKSQKKRDKYPDDKLEIPIHKKDHVWNWN